LSDARSAGKKRGKKEARAFLRESRNHKEKREYKFVKKEEMSLFLLYYSNRGEEKGGDEANWGRRRKKHIFF